ncbi:MAG: glycosyltransferase [Lachnospiraceae bacterium]|nr:glycosyltransferase [Lachnospiraceae bacterium]
MKILITSDWNTDAINGVVTSINNLMYGLRARGHEVKLLALSSSHQTRITEDGWEVASLPADFVYPEARLRVGLMTKIYDKVIEWGPDIVHSQCEFSTFLMAHHIAHECDIPIVHTYHTVYEDYTHYIGFKHIKNLKYIPGRKLNKKVATKAVAEFSKTISRFCQGMIAPTEKVKDLLLGYDSKCPVFVVPSGITLENFRQTLSDDEKANLRNKYEISDDEIVALFLGRVAKEKNINEVMKYISSRDENVKLLVVGDGPELENLKKLATKMDINDRVKFVGMADPKDVWKYYQLGDFFTSASTSETQGLTYIEALSSGLPLLCRKDPCLDDVVEEGENGCLFTNEDEFYSGMDRVLEILNSDGYDRKLIGQSAEKFSRESFARTLETIYLDTLNRYKEEKEKINRAENLKLLIHKVNEYLQLDLLGRLGGSEDENNSDNEI